MLRVLVCSEHDLRPELSKTLIGREGIEVCRVRNLADARLVSTSLGVQVILVDRDLPDASEFIRQLRQEPATRDRSIAVLTRGESMGSDHEMREAGANAILRLPPDEDWDRRFSRLLTVPVRQDARVVARIDVATASEVPAAIINLSAGGMLMFARHNLRVGDELKFRFALPGKRNVAGRGRVARETPPTSFGVEFVALEGDGKDAVLDYLRAARSD
jgi:CheY-like chemotaxis protein